MSCAEVCCHVISNLKLSQTICRHQQWLGDGRKKQVVSACRKRMSGRSGQRHRAKTAAKAGLLTWTLASLLTTLGKVQPELFLGRRSTCNQTNLCSSKPPPCSHKDTLHYLYKCTYLFVRLNKRHQINEDLPPSEKLYGCDLEGHSKPKVQEMPKSPS